MVGISKTSNSNYNVLTNRNQPKIKNPVIVNSTNRNVNSGWPKISYNGMMVNESSKQSIAFVTVDGISNRVKVGDIIAEIKVLSFDQNGITLQRGKEKKVVGK
jgi:hypothetical protein